MRVGALISSSPSSSSGRPQRSPRWLASGYLRSESHRRTRARIASLPARARWSGDAADGEVPAGFPRRQRLRLQVHRRGRHRRLHRPPLHHRHHHRCDVGDRGGDGAGAGEARGEGGHPGAERQGRRGHARAHTRRVPRRRRPRAAARPQLARLRQRLRRTVPLPRPPPPPPHKQCRQVLARAARAVGGRRRDDVRHQLSRAFSADQVVAGEDGGDGGDHRRAGSHRQRVVQRARLVRRRLGGVPPPRHPPEDTLRRHASLRRLQARQCAAHQGTRPAAPGNGRECDGELRPPGHREDPAQPRPRGLRHRSGVLAAVQAAENHPSGCGHRVLRRGPPEAGRRVRPILRRLQRGAAVAGRRQPPRGRAAVEDLRGHDLLKPTGQYSGTSDLTTTTRIITASFFFRSFHFMQGVTYTYDISVGIVIVLSYSSSQLERDYL